MNNLIRLRAAQHKLLSEYPGSSEDKSLSQNIQSLELRKRLKHYRNSLHQKFVIFHIAETTASIETELHNSEVLSAKLRQSREEYASVFVSFAENLGDAAALGVEGNYFSMLTHSVKAVVDFFQRDSSLRNELHAELLKKMELDKAHKTQSFVEGDASVDAYLSALRSEHYYFQSEIERLYHSGQINNNDFQQGIAISSGWKEEIISAIVNLREYNFQQYAKAVADSKKIQAAPYRNLAMRIVSEYLISPQQTGKIHSLGELDRLKIKILNGRRDSNITDAINKDTAIQTEAIMQNRTIYVDRNSSRLKALVATLKREVLGGGKHTDLDDENLMSLLSERLTLMTKIDLTEDERLTYYADYYFNKVEEKAADDELLEKRLIPHFSYWDFKENSEDKGEMLYEALSHVGRDLLSSDLQVVSQADVNERLLLLQKKVDVVLNYYYMNFKKELLSSSEVGVADEKKIDLFAINYFNHLLKQSRTSRFYLAYFHGLVKFKAMLPEPNQIVLTEDVKKSGQVKVLFLGNVFSRLNALNGAKKGWAKLRCCTLFNGVSQHACSHPEESLESADSTP